MALDTKSLRNTLNAIKRVSSTDKKALELCRRLAEIGVQSASVRFASALYAGHNDASVSLVPLSNGYEVIAEGESVCFIEFGSGVHYNGTGIYPLSLPDGVSEIGTFGKGKGAHDYWFYKGEPGTLGQPSSKRDGLVYTHGNPASMPMYYASEEMHDAIYKIAKEVFA